MVDKQVRHRALNHLTISYRRDHHLHQTLLVRLELRDQIQQKLNGISPLFNLSRKLRRMHNLLQILHIIKQVLHHFNRVVEVQKCKGLGRWAIVLGKDCLSEVVGPVADMNL
jgi:hypothetical protein